MNKRFFKILLSFTACIVLIFCILHFKMGGIFAASSFLSFFVITVLSAFAILTPYGKENYFDKHKKGSILIMTASFIILVLSLTLRYELCPTDPGLLAPVFNNICEFFNVGDLFGYYTAQLSLTFITISVMSVLSDKSVIIYWANVSEDMLIRPTFSCFAAFTYYSIGATIGAGFGIVLKNPPMFIIFFALNIVVLISLTLSMIDVYYGRDTKKKKLARTLVPDNNNKASYENKLLSLEQNLLSAYDQKDVLFLKEVYELYSEHSEKFHLDLGQEAISVMVSTLDAQTTGPFLRAYDKVLIEKLSNFNSMNKEKIFSIHSGKLNVNFYDECLWWALGTNRAYSFLDEVSVNSEENSTPNGMMFTRILSRRLTLEYNIYASYYIYYKLQNGEKVNPQFYFIYDDPINSLYEPRTSDGNYLSYEIFKEVYDFAKTELIGVYNSFLLDRTILLIDRIIRDGKNWYTLKVLSAVPYIDYWANGGLDGGIGAYNPEVREAVKRIKEIHDLVDLR